MYDNARSRKLEEECEREKIQSRGNIRIDSINLSVKLYLNQVNLFIEISDLQYIVHPNFI